MEIRNYKGIDYPQLIRLLKSVYDSEIIQSVLEQNYISDTKSILVAVDEALDFMRVSRTFEQSGFTDSGV